MAVINQTITPDNENGFDAKSCLAAAGYRATLFKYNETEEDHADDDSLSESRLGQQILLKYKFRS